MLLDVGDHIWYDFTLEGAQFPENGIVPATGFRFEGESTDTVSTDAASADTASWKKSSPFGDCFFWNNGR